MNPNTLEQGHFEEKIIKKPRAVPLASPNLEIHKAPKEWTGKRMSLYQKLLLKNLLNQRYKYNFIAIIDGLMAEVIV